MSGDVVDLIMQDHREVERLFSELQSSPEKRPNLVPVLATLLTAHSRAEEAEVYPAARSEAGETDEVAHSQEEHVEAEQILARLAAADPTSTDFDRILTELVEAINHHVEEEESNVLPGIKQRLSDQRRAELGRAFTASRKQHLGQEPDDLTRDQLKTQAQNVGMSGASQKSKAELERELKS